MKNIKGKISVIMGLAICLSPMSAFANEATVVDDNIPSIVETSSNYKVTYDFNGACNGTIPRSSNAVNGIAKVGDAKDLVKYNKEWTGNWNTEANGSGISYAPGDEILLTENTTLYVEWKNMTDPDNPIIISEPYTKEDFRNFNDNKAENKVITPETEVNTELETDTDTSRC